MFATGLILFVVTLFVTRAGAGEDWYEGKSIEIWCISLLLAGLVLVTLSIAIFTWRVLP